MFAAAERKGTTFTYFQELDVKAKDLALTVLYVPYSLDSGGLSMILICEAPRNFILRGAGVPRTQETAPSPRTATGPGA